VVLFALSLWLISENIVVSLLLEEQLLIINYATIIWPWKPLSRWL